MLRFKHWLLHMFCQFLHQERNVSLLVDLGLDLRFPLYSDRTTDFKETSGLQGLWFQLLIVTVEELNVL